MNLKEQLKSIAETSKKKAEEEKRKREFPEPVTRTDEDWEIISEYIRKLLMQYSSDTSVTVNKVFGHEIKKRFIYINCKSDDIKKPKRRVRKKILKPSDPGFLDEMFEEEVFGRRTRAIREEYERIVLKDGKELEICNEDMQRFCNQYNIKLAYYVYQNNSHWNCEFSTDYCGVNETAGYLIYPKPMLRTEKELDIINEYLESLLKRYACEKGITQTTVKTIFGHKIKKNYIYIDIEDENIKGTIVDNEEYVEYLDIYNEDIERFCNQHDLKLEYEYKYRTEPIIESGWDGAICTGIRYIKVKPIKYCIEIE